MKRMVLFAFFLTIFTKSFSQLKFNDIKTQMSFSALFGNLTYGDYPRKFISVSYNDMPDSLTVFYANEKMKFQEYKLLKQNNDDVENVIKFTFTSFLFDKEHEFPIKLLKKSDNTITFYLSNLLVDNVYNTYKNTKREIASKVMEEYLIKKLSAFQQIKNPLVKTYAISCIYGVRNFINTDDKSTYQFLGLVASKALVNKFLDASITLKDFLKQCDIYYNDEIGDFQKIDIVLK